MQILNILKQPDLLAGFNRVLGSFQLVRLGEPNQSRPAQHLRLVQKIFPKWMICFMFKKNVELNCIVEQAKMGISDKESSYIFPFVEEL